MENENKDSCEKLLSGLDKIIEKKVYAVLDLMGFEASDYAVVKNLSGTTTDTDGNITAVTKADVKIGETTVQGLLNKTGEILSVGDKVKIYGSQSNLSNRYIGLKL